MKLHLNCMSLPFPPVVPSELSCRALVAEQSSATEVGADRTGAGTGIKPLYFASGRSFGALNEQGPLFFSSLVLSSTTSSTISVAPEEDFQLFGVFAPGACSPTSELLKGVRHEVTGAVF